MQTNEIAITATNVKDRFDLSVAYYLLGSDDRGDASGGPRTVGKVDGVDTGVFESFCFFYKTREVVSAWRRCFDRLNPTTFKKFSGELTTRLRFRFFLFNDVWLCVEEDDF